MESFKVSLCPVCSACPELEIQGDEVRIGERTLTYPPLAVIANRWERALKTRTLPGGPRRYAGCLR